MGNKKKSQKESYGEVDNIVKYKKRSKNNNFIKLNKSISKGEIKHTNTLNLCIASYEDETTNTHNESDVSEEMRKKKKKRKSSNVFPEVNQIIDPPKIQKKKKKVVQMFESQYRKNEATETDKNSTKPQKNKIKLRNEAEPKFEFENIDDSNNALSLDDNEFLNEKTTDDSKNVSKKSKIIINKTKKANNVESENKKVLFCGHTSKENPEKTQINKPKFLNEDEAEVRDEDIDKFIDEITEEDNKTYESWVKLFEENFKKSKNVTS